MPKLTLNGHQLYYSESRHALSRRPPLVLVHGAGGQNVHWPPHLRRLPLTDVYAPDLPGHGKSEGAGRRTLSASAADVLAFMDALGVRRAVVGGHSMGGVIALTLALNHPDRLAGLLLVGAAAQLNTPPKLRAALRDDYTAAVDLILDLAYGPGAPEQLRRMGRRELLSLAPEVLRGDYAAANGFDVVGRLSAIRLSTLVVVGSEDQLTPPGDARVLAAGIPEAKLVVVEGAGHMLPIEAPDELVASVESWLASLPAP